MAFNFKDGTSQKIPTNGAQLIEFSRFKVDVDGKSHQLDQDSGFRKGIIDQRNGGMSISTSTSPSPTTKSSE